MRAQRVRQICFTQQDERVISLLLLQQGANETVIGKPPHAVARFRIFDLVDKFIGARIALVRSVHSGESISSIAFVRSPRMIQPIPQIIIERSLLAVVVHAAIQRPVTSFRSCRSGFGTERREPCAERRRKIGSELLEQRQQPHRHKISSGATC